MPRFRLVLGTHNRKKIAELRTLLGACPIELGTLDDFPGALQVEESGKSFAENAALKAQEQARHLGAWVLGEDSGLSVDALQGAPGIHSARFAGAEATDEKNNALLLQRLSGVPLERRTAHYTCHATLADPAGNIRADAEARCSGRILLTPAGSAGFGYDPLVEIPEYHLTFAQLGDAVKSVLSHRARAIRRLIPAIQSLASDCQSAPSD